MPKPQKWKRKGPKSTRAGCMMCKPWKHQGRSGMEKEWAIQVRRQVAAAHADVEETRNTSGLGQ